MKSERVGRRQRSCNVPDEPTPINGRTQGTGRNMTNLPLRGSAASSGVKGSGIEHRQCMPELRRRQGLSSFSYYYYDLLMRAGAVGNAVRVQRARTNL